MRPSPLTLRALALLTAVGALGMATTAARADDIRIATLVPDDSSWMTILRKAAGEIETKSAGRVKIKYDAGGVHGDERDLIRKINLGQLDGAAVTSVGLATVDASIRVLELPRMFATIEELDYVADKMWPHFQKKFDAKGYILQDRSEVGWSYFLTKSQITSVADLRAIKMWTWGDDVIGQALFKKLGIAGAPLGVLEVEPNLTTGRINACYGTPLAAIALRWHTKVSFMTSMTMSHTIGATLMKKDAYDKLSSDDRALVDKVTRGMSKALRRQVRKDNESARKVMESKGVKVAETPAAVIAELDKAAMAVWTDLQGKVYSKDELAMVLKYRDEYRAKPPVK